MATSYCDAGTSRVAMNVNGTVSYLLPDQLGSTTVTTNSAGQRVSELRYKACGWVRRTNDITTTFVCNYL